jgi:DnaJ-class molecular chaperone
VDRLARPEEIHGAYRALAKRYHPDLSHRRENAKFIQIQEAYDTLRDGNRRREYDGRHGDETPPESKTSYANEPASEPLRSRKVYPEDDLRGLFNRPERSGGARRTYRRELHLRLLLSAEEALQGVTVPVIAPSERPCPLCSAFFQDPFCLACGGRGRIRGRRRFALEIPSRTVHGDTLRYGPGYTGLPNVDLVVRVLVRAGA